MHTNLARAAVGLLLIITAPLSAFAQTASQRQDNIKSWRNIEDQMRIMGARITAAEAEGRISRSKGATLRHKIEQASQSFRIMSRQQGFISAGERASYQRSLDAVSLQLPKY